MNLNEFKDLKRGDLVGFSNVQDFGKKISGQGNVYGFGRIGFTDIVWVSMADGYTRGLPYEEIKKL
ncbi:hypothetical protein GN277_18330 [Lachnospiraceae bacterium WCA-9-b2]|uniref:Uncharacterized protein n=1 Tax=Sporofaciens musculi TaxID=2681861 RepID=A0A7X3SK87_9FIRM|nr:hypothetical protein [Sporofaciens musculi]MXP77262.1 hypothetical protein [Sporofaciens musculi]